MKKLVAFVLCAFLAALSFADDAMAFLSEIKSYGTSRSAQLTEDDVLQLFNTVASVPSQSVKKGNSVEYIVHDISNIQILNPITMQKESGYKAVEFSFFGNNLAFVKKPDLLRRIDAMLKTGNTDLVEKVDVYGNLKIADVLWTNGEMYKVTWVE